MYRTTAGELRASIAGSFNDPPPAIVLQPPLAGPLVQVEVNGRTIETVEPDRVTLRECPADVVMRAAAG